MKFVILLFCLIKGWDNHKGFLLNQLSAHFWLAEHWNDETEEFGVGYNFYQLHYGNEVSALIGPIFWEFFKILVLVLVFGLEF